MTRSVRLGPAKELLRGSGSFALEHEEPLPHLELAFEWCGPADAPVVLALGGISAHAHVAAHSGDPARGWWHEFVGEGEIVDTNRFRVLGIDWIGGAHASLAPRRRDREHWPVVTSTDQARALLPLLDHLGIDQLHAVLGSSYGGMVGFALAVLAPERVRELVAISAGLETDPMATAWRSLQRRVLRLGAGGDAAIAAEALAITRGFGMATYRSADEFRERFCSTPERSQSRPRFPVEDYLEARGRAFLEQFSAVSEEGDSLGWSGLLALHTLSLSIDLHRVDPKTVTVPTRLVAVDRDTLVPAVQLRTVAESLPDVREFTEIESIYGHDAFLKEPERIGPVIRRALEGER